MSSTTPLDVGPSSNPSPKPPPSTSPGIFPTSPSDRLSLAFGTRFGLVVFSSTAVGALLGLSHGSQTTALRFRAENSHRLPTTPKGWYLYHKSKNYAVALGGLREARRMGVKLGTWTALFFIVEDVVDAGRAARAEDWGEQPPGKDALSTICAGLTTAGAFSLWNGLPLTTAASMVRMGLGAGVAYGAAQDVINVLRGRRVGYVEWIKKIAGFGRQGGNSDSI